MIPRLLEKPILRLSKQYPVVTITGPRQSGKTTLSRLCFPKHFYCSLEDLDQREQALEDPRGFLFNHKEMIIDEVQRVPSLVSYIQGVVDQSDRPGQFILTGSHQFELTSVISQSLAGRTAIAKLLPFSMKELNEEIELDTLLYRGFYPRIIDKDLSPTEALGFYTNTYLERDLREIKEVRNLKQFEGFLKLCASNVGQIVNKNRFANDLGVDGKTIDSWFSILEASYIIFLLPPHFKNFRKRVVKSPKLYFQDVGLLCYLLGIKNPSHVASHPLKGSIFENLIVMEKVKDQYNKLEKPSLYFFRDNTGNEVDIIEDHGAKVSSYEIKLSKTLSQTQFKGLTFYQNLNPNNDKSYLVYTGVEKVEKYGSLCLPYRELI